LEECMKKFPVFAAALFNTPNSWLESFGNWTATWRKVFNYARKDCFYDERQAEEGFRQAIGVDTLMLGMVDNEFTPKVGVTTTRSLIGSEIITSYNHFHKSLIPWTQRDNQCPDLQAWEA